MQKKISCVPVGDFLIGPGHPLVVMSGPCVIESREHTLRCAEELVTILEQVKLPLIFKASYDKANRSAHTSFRGPGLDEGLRILEEVKNTFNIPIITDVHTAEQANSVAEVADILQIPAFLCRQTDLLLAVAKTNSIINIKKGQFLAPWDMKNIVDKVLSTGNNKILLMDRGTSFGYNNLVSDMRSIPIMSSLGHPACFDASHSVQLPGGHGTYSGGQREFIAPLAKAAVAAGCHALYIESHPNPKEAKSDATTVFPFSQLPALLQTVKAIHEIVSR